MTFRWIYSDSKKVTDLPWQNKYFWELIAMSNQNCSYELNSYRTYLKRRNCGEKKMLRKILGDLRDIFFFLFILFARLLMWATFSRIFFCVTFTTVSHLKLKKLLSGEWMWDSNMFNFIDSFNVFSFYIFTV